MAELDFKDLYLGMWNDLKTLLQEIEKLWSEGYLTHKANVIYTRLEWLHHYMTGLIRDHYAKIHNLGSLEMASIKTETIVEELSKKNEE